MTLPRWHGRQYGSGRSLPLAHLRTHPARDKVCPHQCIRLTTPRRAIRVCSPKAPVPVSANVSFDASRARVRAGWYRTSRARTVAHWS